MALQFNPYPGAKTKRQQQDENFDQFNSGLQTIGAQWRAYKLQQKQQELQDMELEMKKREYQSKFGTGVAENIQPGQLTQAPNPSAGPEEQMFGFEATMPTMTEETPEQKLRRMGSENYKLLNPQQYGSYVIGADGKPQFMALPDGFKPAPSIPMPTPILDAEGRQVGSTTGKPTVLPKPNVGEVKAEGESAEAQSIAESAIAELNRIRPLNENSRGGLLGSATQKIESKLDSDKPSEEFTNTADVINSLKGMVVSVLKSTFGGQLSDGEREYLNEVYGAVEGMSRAERKIAMDGVERTLRAAQKRASSKAAAVGGSPAPSSDTGPSGVPTVGGTFQGGKVLSVKRIK